MKAVYSFIIDGDPKFEMQTAIFLRTLLNTGVCPSHVIAHCTPTASIASRRLAASFGIEILSLKPYEDERYCNKVVQLPELLKRPADLYVLCDTDLAFLTSLESLFSNNTIRAKPVDAANPPIENLNTLRAALRIRTEPRLVNTTCDHQPTYSVNCNGGLYIIPHSIAYWVASDWQLYTKLVRIHKRTYEEWFVHSDQIGFAMALLSRGLDIEEIPVEYNFPMHLGEMFDNFAFGIPKVLHYHDLLGADGFLRSVGNTIVDEAVAQVNALLRRPCDEIAGLGRAPGKLIQPTLQDAFHNLRYARMNARRMEHLATLMLPIDARSVLELGAGVGDLTSFFLDRGCAVTSIEPRSENVSRYRSIYENQEFWPEDRLRIIQASISGLGDDENVSVYDVVFCAGLLYHLDDPAAALRIMADRCSEFIILETCVSDESDDDAISFYDEDLHDPTNSVTGRGALPSRKWIVNQLREQFCFVYCPITQPNHEQFILEWGRPAPSLGRRRAVFIASHRRINNRLLTETLPLIQYHKFSLPPLDAIATRTELPTIICDTIFGPIAAFPNDLITGQLVEFGAHTRNEVAMLRHFVDKGDLVYDVGAHIGTFSIPLAAAAGNDGRVIAVEADPQHFELLHANLQCRGLTFDRNPLHAAIMDIPSRYDVERAQGNTGAARLRIDPAGIMSTAYRLDDLHEELGHLRRVAVIKIDVEGMELSVLQSARNIIEKDKPVLYVEIVAGQLENYGTTVFDIEAILRPVGYRLFRNIGQRNSGNDRFDFVEMTELSSGGAFFDLLAIAEGDPKLDRALSLVGRSR